MKKNLLIIIVLFIVQSSFGQLFTKEFLKENVSSEKFGFSKELDFEGKKTPDFNVNSNKSLGVWVLPDNGSTSGNTRIPGNTFRFQRTSYLITAAEIAASGFPSNHLIDAIGYRITTAGATAQTGSFKIWLRNTTDVTYTLGSTWTTSGFTQVADIPAWTVPIAAGNYTIPFTGGSPFTYTGGGVYVAWEFSNPAGTLGTTALVGACNNTLTSSLFGERSATALPTTLTASAFRPATMFVNNSIVDIANITNIYTLEKTAQLFSTPTPIRVRVVNNSASATSFNLTITVRDATNTIVRYTETLPVTALAANSARIINFAAWNPTINENVVITATTSVIPTETWTSNNTLTINANVNSTTKSHNFSLANSPTAFGFTTAGGIFLSLFNMNGSGLVNSANISIGNNTPAVGNTVYAVVMNAAGSIVAQSANHVIQTSDLNTIRNFTFPTPVPVSNQIYFIGLAQTAAATQYFPLGVFLETPTRDSTFFTAELTGAGLSLLPNTFNIRFGIEAVVGPTGSCIPPSSLLANNITPFTANLAWSQSGSVTSWEYAFGVSPLPVPTGAGINTTSNTTNPLTGLTHNTTYQYYVRANCGVNGFSTWSGPHTFTTAFNCQPVGLPFFEGFEGTVFPPLCWTNLDVDNDTHFWQRRTSPDFSTRTGVGVAASASWIPPGNPLTPNNYLITPQIAIPSGSNVVLRFWVAAQDNAWPQEKYSIMVSTTGTLPANFTSIFTQTLTDSVFREVTLPLNAYAGQNIHIAFRHHDCTDWFWIKIDDVQVITLVDVEKTEEIPLKLYPNPASDYLYINEFADVQVFNIHGKLVDTYSNVNKIDVKHLSSGIYIFKLKTDKKSFSTYINIIR